MSDKEKEKIKGGGQAEEINPTTGNPNDPSSDPPPSAAKKNPDIDEIE